MWLTNDCFYFNLSEICYDAMHMYSQLCDIISLDQWTVGLKKKK